MKRILYASLCLAFILQGCNNAKEQQKKSIALSGAFALYPLVQQWANEYSKLHPEITFYVQAGGAGKGLTDVLSGATDVGMYSQQITYKEMEKGIWWIALCKEAVLPVVNAKNPYLNQLMQQGLTKDELKTIFLYHAPSTWDSLLHISNSAQHSMNIYTRSDVSGSAESWASWFGMKQANLTGTGIAGDSSLTAIVKQDTNAIAYSNSVFVFDSYSGEKFPGIETVPIDLNGNNKIDSAENFYHDLSTFLQAVHDEKFPSPPARNLYFITAKRPMNPEIMEFFKWVLTDGQKFLTSAGYVPLKPAELKEQVMKVAPASGYDH